MSAGRLLVVLVIALLVAGCARDGHYGAGQYQGPNTRWHGGYHTVRKGDTLYSVAWQYGYDFEVVARWNNIGAPYRIHPGQRLRLTPPPASSQQARSAPSQPRGNTTPRADTRTTGKTSPKPAPSARNFAWRWPVHGEIIGRFATGVAGKSGLEIAGKRGEPIRAAAPGYVVYSGSGLRGYGRLIIIKHNETYLSAYAHNSKLRVKENEQVKMGQHIADMGSSGTNRNMLHFEIRRDGKPVDPLKYLPKR